MAFLRFLTKPIESHIKDMLGISRKKVQAAPFVAPPEPLATQNREATAAGLNERKKRAAQKGRQSTILSGSQTETQAPLATKSLLGG